MKLSKGMLLGIGGLVLAALVILVMENREVKEDPRIGENLLTKDEIFAISEVEIATGTEKIALKAAQGGEWLIASGADFPVDVTRVRSLLESLSELKVLRVATRSKEQFDKFGLKEERYLQLKSKDRNIKLWLGESRTGGGQYVAFAGEDKAYLISNNIAASPSETSWQYATLVNIPAEKIKKVEFFITGRKTPYAAERATKEESLKLASATSSSQKVIDYAITSLDSVLQNVNYSHRHDLSNELAKTALAKGQKAKVTLFDGREYEVTLGAIGKKDEEKYFIAMKQIGEGKDLSEEDKAHDALLAKMMDASAYEVAPFIYKKFVKKEDDVFEKSVSQQNKKVDKKG